MLEKVKGFVTKKNQETEVVTENVENKEENKVKKINGKKVVKGVAIGAAVAALAGVVYAATKKNQYDPLYDYLKDEIDNFDDDDDELYEITCPTCGDTILLDEGMIEEGSMNCPNCNELLEFYYDDLTIEDFEDKDEAPEKK